MWLLDVNMPQPLVRLLGELGIMAETTHARGWGELTNGQLVATAISQGFTCLLTRDQLFGESARHAIKKLPTFAIVLITLPQHPAPQFLDQFRSAWNSSPLQPSPGQITRWP